MGYRDDPKIRQEIHRLDQERRVADERDVVIQHPRRLTLRSPNGHFWSVQISDTGAISAVDIGTDPL